MALHPKIQQASEKLEIHLPHLAAAGKLSEELIQEARTFLRQELPEIVALDVLAFGSMARRELTRQSDLDSLVVVHSLPDDVLLTRKVLSAVEQMRKKLALKKAGGTNTFGGVVAATDLTERIGLERDTNQSHTLRMLILEESVSLLQPTAHDRLVQAILERYLVGYGATPKVGVPRFLLNDVVRFWRTIAVDYQGKWWEEWHKRDASPDTPGKQSIRYVKLRVSRKLVFASTLASLFLPQALGVACTDVFLLEQFKMPPLARLAQLVDHLLPSERVSLGTVLEIADHFLGDLGNDRLKDETAEDDWKERSRTLQAALEDLFFDTERFGKVTRRYLSF